MINPHIIVDPETRRCLCGLYDIDEKSKRVTCNDLIDASRRLADQGNPEGKLLFTVLHKQIQDCI